MRPRLRGRRAGVRYSALLVAAGAGGDRPRRHARRLGPEGQLVDRVLGLDVELLTAGIAEHALDRRRHHAMSIRIAEDHHAAADAGIADQVTGVGAADPERGALPSVIPDLSRGYADHRASPE